MKNNFKNILHISPDFNYCCGVSKYVFTILKNFSESDSYKLFFITNGGDALDKLEEIGVEPYILQFSRGWKNILNLLPNLNTLKNFCIRNHIDIIHTHHRYPEYMAHLVSKKIKIKTITTVHSLVKGKNKFSFKSDKLIAVSKAVEKMLSENYHVPANKITMLYNSIEPLNVLQEESIEGLRNKYNISSKAKIILFLGRITKLKGIDILIDVFNKIQTETDDLILLIVGQIYDNSLKNTLETLHPNIKLINPVKNPGSFYFAADIVILPSRGESLPYVMLESGLFKKPFIGSNTGGISEFIEDGVNGLLFEPENVYELADKIKYILNYPEEAKTLGENLYLKVKENISNDKYCETLSEIYDNLILEK